MLSFERRRAVSTYFGRGAFGDNRTSKWTEPLLEGWCVEIHEARFPVLSDLPEGERPGLWELMLDSAVHMLRKWLGGRSSSRNKEALGAIF